MSDADDFLDESGGYPTIKFVKPGAILAGDMADARRQAENEFGTKNPLYWPDGRPREQLVFDAEVDYSGSSDIKVGKNDDQPPIGTHYCKYRLKEALRKACDDEGIKISQVGRFKIRRLEDLPPPKPGLSPVQNFEAKVQRKPNTGADDLGGF